MNDQGEEKKKPILYWVVVAVCITIILSSLFILFQATLFGEKVVITEYSVTTVYNEKECIYGLYNPSNGDFECQQWGVGDEIFTLPGFYSQLSEDAVNVRYEVTFKIVNRAGGILDVIGVKVLFCDENNNELCSKITSVYDIPNSYVTESSVTLYRSETIYFYNIEQVRFEIITD